MTGSMKGDPEDRKGVVKLLDHFKHVGPNGQHVSMVFEYLGDSLLSLIKYTCYRGLPLDIVRELCVPILVGLDYLHRELSIIHTDLKPENILLLSSIDPSNDPRKYEEPPLLSPVIDKPNLLLSSSSRKDTVNGAISRTQKIKLKRKAKRAANNCVSSVIAREKELDSANADQGNVNSGQTGVTNTEIILAGESAAQHEAEKKARHSAKIQGFKSMDLRCKIIDLGNACWIHKQFTT
jgi:serine/threonine-protein kinase SRPK3